MIRSGMSAAAFLATLCVAGSAMAQPAPGAPGWSCTAWVDVPPTTTQPPQRVCGQWTRNAFSSASVTPPPLAAPSPASAPPQAAALTKAPEAAASRKSGKARTAKQRKKRRR